MRHEHLPHKFTRIGLGEDGKEYIQCTRTGDVLVQTDSNAWGQYAGPREWRSRVAAQLYPELIHLQRTLKEVGNHEEVEEQLRVLRRAIEISSELRANIERRIARLEKLREEPVQVGTGR
jgi:hypothetical protein